MKFGAWPTPMRNSLNKGGEFILWNSQQILNEPDHVRVLRDISKRNLQVLDLTGGIVLREDLAWIFIRDVVQWAAPGL
jgi:hypothetical protein